MQRCDWVSSCTLKSPHAPKRISLSYRQGRIRNSPSKASSHGCHRILGHAPARAGLCSLRCEATEAMKTAEEPQTLHVHHLWRHRWLVGLTRGRPSEGWAPDLSFKALSPFWCGFAGAGMFSQKAAGCQPRGKPASVWLAFLRLIHLSTSQRVAAFCCLWFVPLIFYLSNLNT